MNLPSKFTLNVQLIDGVWIVTCPTINGFNTVGSNLNTALSLVQNHMSELLSISDSNDDKPKRFYHE